MLTVTPGPTAPIEPPRQTGGNVLYLDFDSVLHPGEVYVHPGRPPVLVGRPDHVLFEHAPLLDLLLKPYPSVIVVLSTSWVRHYRGSIRRIAALLPEGLGERVVGATYHSRVPRHEFDSASRGLQVWRDVLRRKPDRWLALDDDDEAWPAWCRDNLVLTHKVHGISAGPVLSELQSKLKSVFGDHP
jgi:hypothetical protein